MAAAATGSGTTACASAATTETLSVFEQVLRLAAASRDDGRSSALPGRQLSANELQREINEIRKLHSPPVLVRRTLEAVYLLMNAAKVAWPASPPAWSSVQRMLADISFLSRMQSFKCDALRDKPELTAYICSEYFGSGPRSTQARTITRKSTVGTFSSPSGNSANSGATVFRKTLSERPSIRKSATLPRVGRSVACDEPLTYQRVQYSSSATAALFTWCTTVLVDALDPTPPEERQSSAEVVAVTPTSRNERLPPLSPRADTQAQDACLTQYSEIHRVLDVGLQEPLSSSEPKAEEQLKVDVECNSRIGAYSAPVAPIEKLSKTESTVRLSEAAPMPSVVLPAPKAKAKALAVVPKQRDKPDRHFEAMVTFDTGFANQTVEGVHMIQNVAATVAMRPKLGVELVSCPDRRENKALAETRLRIVEEFLVKEGIKTERPEKYPLFGEDAKGESNRIEPSDFNRVCGEKEDPGVVCKLVLKNDRELRDFFLLLGTDEEFKISAHAQMVVETLENDFNVVKY